MMSLDAAPCFLLLLLALPSRPPSCLLCKLLRATSDLLNSNSMSFTTSRQALMNLADGNDGEITSQDLDEEDTA